MCSNRLAVNEPPACVQSCPNEAIRITVVRQDETRSRYASDERAAPCESSEAFLPDTPDPTLTIPATRFVSRRPLPEVAAADRDVIRFDTPHGPLVAMLFLTQSAAGLFLASAFLGRGASTTSSAWIHSVAFLLLMIGLSASVLHLGRPTKAWRSFLGWRRSWLSREIIVFNAFAAVGALATAAPWVPSLTRWATLLAFGAASVGLLGVATSSMVYVDTGRPFWQGRLTFGSFLGTMMVAGFGFAALAFLGTGASHEARAAAGIMGLSQVCLLAWRSNEIGRVLATPKSPLHWNARVIEELLPVVTRCLVLLAIVAVVGGLLAWVDLGGQASWWIPVSAMAAILGEGMNRRIFFLAGGSKRMPGGILL